MRIAREVYGADGVDFEPLAAQRLAALQERPDAAELGVCMVKTQYSLSDAPQQAGRARLLAAARARRTPVWRRWAGGAGSGRHQPYAGHGSRPGFRNIDVDVETGQVSGLF